MDLEATQPRCRLVFYSLIIVRRENIFCTRPISTVSETFPSGEIESSPIESPQLFHLTVVGCQALEVDGEYVRLEHA